MTDTPKPSTNEDEYFARENLEKVRKLALEQSKLLQREEKEALKKLHWMHCPKCGMELQTVEFKGVEIERCFSCGATVFDHGELEKLGLTESKGGAVMKSILNLFR